MLGGRNMHTCSAVSKSASCHGAVAKGQVLSVFAWICWVIWEMHVKGNFLFLVLFVFLGWVRCAGRGGGWVNGRFQQCMEGTLAMMGWLSSSWERCRASASNLYSK